jgi:hypothetical protein
MCWTFFLFCFSWEGKMMESVAFCKTEKKKKRRASRIASWKNIKGEQNERRRRKQKGNCVMRGAP